MARVVDPLRRMGANITYENTAGLLPLLVRGAQLTGSHHQLKVPSAQVKTALQLAGLFAEGETTIGGADGARDHTERLFSVMGQSREPYNITIPADPSAAAFFQVAGALIPNSIITIQDLCLNPGRAGTLAVLRRAGAKVEIEQTVFNSAEPMGQVVVSHSSLQPFTIEADEVPSLIDELPILAVLATQAAGTSTITGAADLRVKECDRISATTVALKSLGAHINEHDDGWTITGPTSLRGGHPDHPVVINTHGDHRIAMSMAIAALISEGTIALDDDSCVGVSFLEFFVTLDKLIALDSA